MLPEKKLNYLYCAEKKESSFLHVWKGENIFTKIVNVMIKINLNLNFKLFKNGS